jgi:hypothetical protein
VWSTKTPALRSATARLAVALTCILLTAAAGRADLGDCGQPLTAGPTATASDCLFLLQASVDSVQCATPCICDVDRSGATTATDALFCLRIAVGTPLEKTCYCPYAQININVAGTGSNPMVATETAGAPGVNDDNWNNLAGAITDGMLAQMIDGAGSVVSNATASYIRLGLGTLNEGGGSDDGHFFSSNADAYNYPAFEYTITGVPYPRYDVYAYHQGGAPAGLRRVAHFSIGELHLYANRPEDFAYRQSTATTDTGTATPIGSYVAFRDLTASSFTLTLGGGSASDGVPRNRFAGFQIVGVELID